MRTELEELSEFVRRVPRIPFKTIFDVGANVGQTTRMFRRLWPDAQIYAFEPVLGTYERLTSTYAGTEGIACFNLALGNQPMRARMESNPLSRGNRIVETKPRGKAPIEEVEVETGDRFCAAHQIGSIDFLKIDAEGFDLKVCQGFETMLKQQQIAAVQVEVGMQLTDPLLVPLHALMEYLGSVGYGLFKIHNQYVHPHVPMARRANAVFISMTQVKANTILATELLDAGACG